MDGAYKGVFPGGGDVIGGDARVDEQKDVTYGAKGEFQDADTEAVSTASRGVPHTEDDAV